ncbi:MAG: type II toxin-antitoxin system PemK/MazF family toxin [Rhodococcus sp.]|nr:type II toxin-antitoxin system PemK/MazF family toxin [Rhodococcus sp. (in: high G+C Gram-positive bacteria)]
MKRGEVWTVAGGAYASKPRPAVIIQDDLFASTDSVLVAPFTSTLVSAPLMRIRVDPTVAGDSSGLESASDIMVDKVTSVRRSTVQAKIGRLSPELLVDVDRALMVILGLAR